jgi:biotin synthase
MTQSVRYTKEEIETLYDKPFNELAYQAHTVFREYFDPNTVQTCTLLSIKTGTCPEDCAYCPQSAHYKTHVEKEALLDEEKILAAAKIAMEQGATRFCMGAAWRNPPEKEFAKIISITQSVKKLGLETCMTVGMLTEQQAHALKEAGLDYYNHNLDSSPEYYEKIISTRTYEDRLNTLANVRKADINVCCGGIIGMGETKADRIGLLFQLANLPKYPESVPINSLIPIEGTPLAKTKKLDPFEFIRTVAVARILMPTAMIRLSGARSEMSDETQAWCFFVGANSIFYGEQLLTTKNSSTNQDDKLLHRLGLKKQTSEVTTESCR